MTPLLAVRGLSKRFPGVQALADVSLEFNRGTIHGLVGENGAGKSTLIKLVTGLETPDRGEIRLDGQPVRFHHWREAQARGIALVGQEIQVVPECSIAENVLLDRLATQGPLRRVDWPALNCEAERYVRSVGLDLPVTTPVKGLSAGQKQLVRIAKALAARARLMFLDEPTSSLTEHEAGHLLGLLRELRSQGVTVLYVSHKLEEVFAVCDEVSVLRDGRHVGTRAVGGLTKAELVAAMIGRAAREERLGRLPVDRGCEMLRAERLTRRGKVREISFALHRGEILGFYGLVGSGRTETARLLIGDDRPDSGAVFVRGERVALHSVRDSLRRCRMGYVTENRKEEGLFLAASVGTNITLTVWDRMVQRWTRRISPAAERGVGQRHVAALDIKCAGLDEPAGNLSGGNQQKICLAKWLAADCDILLIDEPTVGVDIGAKEHLHRLIWELAAQQGKAIILISSDMPEIIKLASRILVFRDQQIAGEVPDVDAPDRTYAEISAAIGRYLN